METPSSGTPGDHQRCPACDELRSWRSASGPGQLVARITRMLDLVAGGEFTEIVVEPDRSPPTGAPWSSLDRSLITTDLMMRPWGDYGLEPEVAIRCARSGTTFTQSWVWERGYEKWTVRDS